MVLKFKKKTAETTQDKSLFSLPCVVFLRNSFCRNDKLAGGTINEAGLKAKIKIRNAETVIDSEGRR